MLIPRLSAGVLALLCCIAPASAWSQGPNDPIPRDVVDAILRNHTADGLGTPKILFGDSVLDSMQGKVRLPPGAHLIVTLVTNEVEFIGTAPEQPDSVRAWWAADFDRRQFEMTDLGRRVAFRAPRESGNARYCSAEGTTYWIYARQRGRGTEFDLHVAPDGCGRGEFSGLQRWSGSGSNPPDLPRLVNPVTAAEAPACDSRGMGQSYKTASINLTTTATPEQLIAHYGAQMDSLGWTHERTTNGVAASWTKRDSLGRSLRTVLIAMPGTLASDCRTMSVTTSVTLP